MPSIEQTASPVALEALRQPIRSFAPQNPGDLDLKISMLASPISSRTYGPSTTAKPSKATSSGLPSTLSPP